MQRTTLCLVLAFCLIIGLSRAEGAEARPLFKDIRGRVVDFRGVAVAEAVVTAMAGGDDPSVLSDADGYFTIPIPAHYVGVLLMATDADRIGYARTVGSSRFVQGELRLELRDTRAIVVSVEDGAGQPVAGARIQVSFDVSPDMAYLGLRPVTTGADGKATLRLPFEAKCRGIGVHTADGRKGGLVATDEHPTQVTVKVQRLVSCQRTIRRLGGPPDLQFPILLWSDRARAQRNRPLAGLLRWARQLRRGWQFHPERSGRRRPLSHRQRAKPSRPRRCTPSISVRRTSLAKSRY